MQGESKIHDLHIYMPYTKTIANVIPTQMLGQMSPSLLSLLMLDFHFMLFGLYFFNGVQLVESERRLTIWSQSQLSTTTTRSWGQEISEPETEVFEANSAVT